jgi:hypothetical protein
MGIAPPGDGGIAVKHPRREPDALIGPVRLCGGAPSNGRPYRDATHLRGFAVDHVAEITWPSTAFAGWYRSYRRS